MKRRVVITGMGVISPVGNTINEFWESLITGKSGVGYITRFDTKDYTTKIAAEVKNFQVEQYIEPHEAKRMEPFCQYAVCAAIMALKDANLNILEHNPNRIGVYIGSGIGGLQILENQHSILLEKGPNRISPFLIPMLIVNMAAGYVSIKTGAKGPNLSISTACAAGAHSIGESFKIIQRGDADVMIAGGTESTITPVGIGGFCAMKALSTLNEEPQKASRPFDLKRDGFVIGEGSGILILEELEYAKRRKANFEVEIIGYGATGDAHHITAPSPNGEGATRCMQMALQDAEIAEVDYINAHGTSTKLNDQYETKAIKKVFGEKAYKIAVSSTKSITGHLLGAAGGVEAIASILSIKNNIIPPTINYEFQDPECDLNYVPNQAKKQEVNTVLSNSLGFGGHNASLIFRSYNK